MKTEKVTNRMTAHYALIQMLFNIVVISWFFNRFGLCIYFFFIG